MFIDDGREIPSSTSVRSDAQPLHIASEGAFVAMAAAMTIDELTDLLSAWCGYGPHIEENGSRYWERRDDGALSRWVHTVVAPYDPARLAWYLFEERSLVPSCRSAELWGSFNSLELFGCRLKTFGPRIDTVGRRPWDGTIDVLDVNLSHPRVADRFAGFIFGEVEIGETSALLIERSDHTVLAVEREAEAVVKEWPDADTALRRCIARLGAAFDPAEPEALHASWTTGRVAPSDLW